MTSRLSWGGCSTASSHQVSRARGHPRLRAVVAGVRTVPVVGVVRGAVVAAELAAGVLGAVGVGRAGGIGGNRETAYARVVVVFARTGDVNGSLEGRSLEPAARTNISVISVESAAGQPSPPDIKMISQNAVRVTTHDPRQSALARVTQSQQSQAP